MLPGEGEAAGLLALMLLTDARRAARTDADGSIVPLAEQRRELWDAAAIAEGLALITRTLGTVPVGPVHILTVRPGTNKLIRLSRIAGNAPACRRGSARRVARGPGLVQPGGA